MSLGADEFHRRLILCVVHAHVADSLRAHVDGVLRSRGSTSKHVLVVVRALTIHCVIAQVAAAERAHEVELLQLSAVSIDKSGPLVHFITGLFIELVLEVVILLLELL